MSLERISKVLVSLGLSEPDARVYIYLALKGPKKLESIVYDLKISRDQIVQSLENLQNKNITISDPESKNGLSVLPFEKALKLLIKAEKEQIIISEENLLSLWKSIIKRS